MTPGQRCFEEYNRTVDPCYKEISVGGNWNSLSEASKQGWDAVARMKLSEEKNDHETNRIVRAAPVCDSDMQRR